MPRLALAAVRDAFVLDIVGGLGGELDALRLAPALLHRHHGDEEERAHDQQPEQEPKPLERTRAEGHNDHEDRRDRGVRRRQRESVSAEHDEGREVRPCDEGAEPGQRRRVESLLPSAHEVEDDAEQRQTREDVEQTKHRQKGPDLLWPNDENEDEDERRYERHVANSTVTELGWHAACWLGRGAPRATLCCTDQTSYFSCSAVADLGKRSLWGFR